MTGYYRFMLRFSPYYGDLDREIGRFIDRQRQKRPAVQFRGAAWRPQVDLFETDDMVVALVELAGVDQSQVDLTIDDRLLIVRGRRADISEHRPHSYHIMEISHGTFERAVPLPANVDAEGTQADIRNGMLQICMPKAQPRQIAIIVTEAANGD
jgi:HSP20 family protein